MTEEEKEAAKDELWNALVSQLRLLLASKETAGELEETYFDAPHRNELTMSAKSGYLSVWLNADTGDGSWDVITEKMQEAEPWTLSADGRVKLSGEEMDVSGLTVRFMEKILPA